MSSRTSRRWRTSSNPAMPGTSRAPSPVTKRQWVKDPDTASVTAGSGRRRLLRRRAADRRADRARPGSACWLVGRSSTTTFRIRDAERASSADAGSDRPGGPSPVSFDAPVRLVELRDGDPRGAAVRPPTPRERADRRRRERCAAGRQRHREIGTRAWESLSSPTRVSWFPARERVPGARRARAAPAPPSPSGPVTRHVLTADGEGPRNGHA